MNHLNFHKQKDSKVRALDILCGGNQSRIRMIVGT